MDGTCNSYQHLSAMGRDPIGGRTTSLLPFEEPQDIYQQVADRASRRIQRDAEDREAQARAQPQEQGEASIEDADAARQLLALGPIDRSEVKHATMTTPYGVTRRTIYKQLVESRRATGCRDPEKCARYLAKVLEECIPEVAVEAGRIMEYMRDIARPLAKANRGMAWTTPSGFYVVHEVREPKPVRIATADHTSLFIRRMKHGRSTGGSKPTASSPILFILLTPHT